MFAAACPVVIDAAGPTGVTDLFIVWAVSIMKNRISHSGMRAVWKLLTWGRRKLSRGSGQPRRLEASHRRVARRRFLRMEGLEDRRMLATFLDESATTLKIVLGINESLTVMAAGNSYQFGANSSIEDGGVANPADFSAFGGTSLTVKASGLARYDTIHIQDGDGFKNASVTFNDSGGNAYSDNFTIELDHLLTTPAESAGSIAFFGQSDFGAFNLNASTSKNIALGRLRFRFCGFIIGREKFRTLARPDTKMCERISRGR